MTHQTNKDFVEDCIFCKIVKHEIPANIIYENDYVLAFLDLNPNANGHTLVIPKKHFENLSSTDDLYLDKVAEAKKLIANRILNSSLKPAGINYTSNQGAEAYQAVFHYHEHIIPKYKREEGYTIVKTENKVSPLKPVEEIYDILKK